ncbi:hypothetical protein [Bacillus sp. 3255]|uniref:hypothetical protein n=1 Tax=Bacillus sp. 3255 TaxID=2817904 RepID=UPI00286AF178|nr:hypothetical protein [Bacillus sp. 3255]
MSDPYITEESLTVLDMVHLANGTLAVEDRVPNVRGEGFDLQSWYESWRSSRGGTEQGDPTHVKVEAVDEFQALMPWHQMGTAFFLYAQDGEPLKKGYPIRLYVPDGSSECLNVKSVVHIWFLHDAALGEEATFGFKNKVTLDELKMKK